MKVLIKIIREIKIPFEARFIVASFRAVPITLVGWGACGASRDGEEGRSHLVAPYIGIEGINSV